MKNKLLLLSLLLGGVIGGLILYTSFVGEDDKKIDAILQDCKEKLDRVGELIDKL